MKLDRSVPPELLLELSCVREPSEFWVLLVEILRLIIPHRSAVIWSYFSTILFQTSASCKSSESPRDTDDFFALRPGALFHVIRAGFDIAGGPTKYFC